jgi:hypothetical protein
MKDGRLKPRALTSYFLTSGHRRGLVLLIRFGFKPYPRLSAFIRVPFGL